MLKAIKLSKAIISTAILLFIVLVVWGVYTAMNSAAGYTLSQSNALELPEVDAGSGVSGKPKTGDAGSLDAATDTNASPDPSGSGADQNADTGNPGDNSSSGSTNGSTGSASNGSSGNSGGSSNNGNSAGNNNPPPTHTEPQKTFHPAWDEWVEEGHWEETLIPATYGSRPVFGSICNECGANISGFAMAHLKETHHSGYREDVVGYEQYEITPAHTERVWVDTSHWVHHDGYWS